MIQVNPTVWSTSFSMYKTYYNEHLPDDNGLRVVGVPMMVRDELIPPSGEPEFYFSSIRSWVKFCELHPTSKNETS